MIEHEAYTKLLIQREEVRKQIESVDKQMDFLFMNIRKDNFRMELEKIHALKELSYLDKASKNLLKESEKLNTMVADFFVEMAREVQ